MSGSGDPNVSAAAGGSNTPQQVQNTSITGQNLQPPVTSSGATTTTQTGSDDARMQAMEQKMNQMIAMLWTMMTQMSTINGRMINIPGDPLQAPPPLTYVAPPPAHIHRIPALPINQVALPLALAPDLDDQDMQTTGFAQTNTVHAMAEAGKGNSPIIAPTGLHPPLNGTSSGGIFEAFPTTLLAMRDISPLADPPVDFRRPDDGDNDSNDDSSNTSEATESTDGSSNGDSWGNDNSGDHSRDDFEENHADDPESDDY